MPRFGMIRVAAISPPVAVADPQTNAEAILAVWRELGDADVLVFPELSLTGYTCADLFAQRTLLDQALEALRGLVEQSAGQEGIAIVGLPWVVQGSLFNCAAVLGHGRLHGLVPKQFLPTYNEFYEARWFRAGLHEELPETVDWDQEAIPFGVDLLFDLDVARLGIEICEDLWVPTPPSGFLAAAGAQVLVNLSASTEIVSKAPWRQNLVVSQSGRCLAAYVYAGAGPSESTTDVVFGGHCMIAENGALLTESRRVGDGSIPWRGATFAVADIDVERLDHDRRVTGSFAATLRCLPHSYRTVAVPLRQRDWKTLKRDISATPFVPAQSAQLHERCAEVFGIQTAALAKRIGRLADTSPLIIGVSGGLDSTLALLAAVKACDAYQWPRQRIHGITMPGFGTSQRTLENARALMVDLGIHSEEIDIRPLCIEAFQSLGHAPLGVPLNASQAPEDLQARLVAVPEEHRHDLVFENVQARLRTFLLMSRGFVLGTGDMSEQALGWSTYNGDHMSMYNVNTSVPKTLVRFLVRYAADHYFDGATRELLHAIADTPISPELLPTSAAGAIAQHTESTVGPYELHDFFLFHVVRNGYRPEKIRFLARHARFSQPYTQREIDTTLTTFLRRFFSNQFKRSCVPDGPKVGSVSLSPRGDWRMPSDAEVAAWLQWNASAD